MGWKEGREDVRVQSPLLRLRQGISFEKLSLNLVDRHASSLILKELRSRSFEAFTATLTVALTSFLTIFSASLFYTARSLIYYPPDGNLLNTGTPDQGLITGTLTLLENASYPAFTYEDLAFPGLRLINNTPPSYFNQTNAVFKTTVPAVRPDFSNCRLYDSSHIGCSSLIWAWGSLINTQPDQPDNTANRSYLTFALGCNDTLETVSSSVTFSAQSMLVDTNNPPTLNYSTATELESFNLTNKGAFYFNLPAIQGPENNTIFDPFFSMIIRSRYAVPVSYLRNSSQILAVADAVRFHRRVLVVQFLSHGWRFENDTQAQKYNYLPVWNETTRFDATAHEPYGTRRIFQDVASTRVLQSVLFIILVCLSVNWFLMWNVTEIPRSPASIANWVALLADGNLDDFLPPNAGRMPLEQISRWYFGQGAVFYFGYRQCGLNRQEILGIYAKK
ncbi:hypothetical protein GGR58DRAFT_521185 [Xylaria digitata]|nr:hypothetical protein GGR58DRAFT_521185 [Xylaria digitata]